VRGPRDPHPNPPPLRQGRALSLSPARGGEGRVRGTCDPHPNPPPLRQGSALSLPRGQGRELPLPRCGTGERASPLPAAAQGSALPLSPAGGGEGMNG